MSRNTYCLDSAFRALRAHPGSTSNEMADKLRWGRNRVRNALKNLRYKGFARTEGRGRNNRWYAVGNMVPSCHWGMHPNSLVNLNVTPEERQRRLKMAGEVLGWDVSPKHKPVRPASNDLDVCWSRFISGKQAA